MSFELSEGKYIALLRRVKILEEAYNDIATAINNLATQQQVQELLVIIQSDIKSFEEKLTALENRVASIEEEPLS
jgi:predicted ATP-grasp superfamily ATP-dependent carboligase